MRRELGESEKFVDAVYRRLIFFHTLEQFGLGFLAASALAILVDVLAFWQSMPTLPILILCGGLGFVLGMALTMYRWPSRWSAVLETDRQLHFSDLLSSALLPANQVDDDFSSIVREMADAQCRQHSPGDVILRRLNVQSWGGIATAIAIACMLCVVPMGLQRSQAMDADSAALTGGELENGKLIPQTNNAASDGAWSADVVQQSDQKSQPGNANHGEGKNAGGSGEGESTDLNSSSNALRLDRQGAGDRNDVGDLAGGGATGASGVPSNGNGSGSKGGMNQASKSVPAWHADSTSNLSATGSQSSGNFHIPAEDADLIRDFFKPR